MMLASLLSWAVVTLSSTFMRAAPDYEAPLDNQLLMGALVQTLDTERYWVKVQAEDYCGWVTNMGLHELSDEDKDAYLAAPKWICVAEYARVREAPSESSAPICDFTMGDLVRKSCGSTTDGPDCSTACPAGWTQVLLPDGSTGWVLSHQIADFRSWMASSPGSALSHADGAEISGSDVDWAARSICSLACSFRGTPYMWGGNSIKHFDCSGLVKFCYFLNGIVLPRNAREQIKCGTPVADGQWQPGDLLFFGSRKPFRVTHVALYIGDGKIVHSSLLVRINSLEEYGREVIGATRILGDVDNGKGAVSVQRDPYYFPGHGK